MKRTTNFVLTLLLLFFTSIAIADNLSAQQSRKSISGVVVDENGDPVIGASIIVPGTSSGAATDINGKFSIDVPADKSFIKVSYVGYHDQQIPVGSKSFLDINLEPSTNKLNEVVAIGYGTVKRKDLTGAVSSIKAKDIVQSPVSNVVEAMQGRVAGLDIYRESGKVNSDSKIQLRGNRSLTPDRDSEPLYVIDGIPGNINNLNPNDIASIDVLKDASSTAIYGAQGANGVIMVTTKQAEKGKVQVDLDAYWGVNSNPSYPRALKGDDWINYLQNGYKATYPTAATPSIPDLLTAYKLETDNLMPYINDGKWVDWVDETLQTGVQQNYAVSIRGGNDRLRGNFSLGYNSNKGVYLGDEAKRYTMRTGVDIQVAKWMNAGIQTGLIWKDSYTIGSRVNKTFGIVPLGDVYDENGNINQYPITGESIVSPIVDNIPGTYENNNKSLSFTANPYVEFKIMDGLTLKSILGTSLGAGRTGTFNSDHTYMKLSGSSAKVRDAFYETSLSYGYTWENILSYNKTIAKDHNIGATFVTSWNDFQSERSSAGNEGFLYDDFLYYNLFAGTKPSATSSYQGYSKMSYTGRVTYAYQGKYLASASIRYDGASQLYNKWYSFPAASAAWRISDEAFMESSQSWLSNLKLRLGWGVTGGYNIAAYSSLTEVTSASDMINLGAGQLPANIPTKAVGNPFLSWEKTYSTNIGLDFGFLNNRIEGSFEYYNTNTDGVLFPRNLPFSGGGFTAKEAYVITGNIGEMSNKGVELTLHTRNIETKNFRWNSTVTFARNIEKVEGVDLGKGIKPADLISLGLFYGHPRDVIYGYKKTGIWQLGEEADAAVFGLQPGDTKIQTRLTKVSDGVWIDNTLETPVEYTATNQYTINSNTGTDDRVIIGPESPEWTAGFNNSFYWNNFDLNIFMTARWGQWIESKILGYYGNIAQPDIYNCWTPDNPTNDFPQKYLQRTTAGKNDPIQSTSLTYVDASFVKIKNITLGYTLPNILANKVGLSSVRVYGTMYNPLIFTKSDLMKGVDPEVGGDNDSFPLYRQMVFGINVSF